MKVYFNLAVPRDRRERYSMVWTVPTLILSIIVLGWMATMVINGLGRSHQIQKSLAEVKTRDAALRTREMELQRQIQRPEFQQMIQKTKFVNELIGQKQFSLTELTLEVSKLLPPSARLNGLALASASVPNPEVQFAVMGKDEEAIESFVIERSGGSPPQVALVCTARYASPVLPPGN